ncbi:AarF/UbiB family protein [Aromatoleum toluolicum]|uniref:Ubiquinone biosynthesis protein UbiB n=1 Tax=Aromatoleum toluolicum TaxID=90060 RepID=A0ABX1NBK7_9RHOO|nr:MULTISPECIES: AarF/UbiB family protein [Rhodocyclales]AKU14331.1 ABC transporter [Azoarcus sp. CIB]AYH45937.1 ubiquinone biosynthesis protein UbiB [Azoarcus sp. DN11]NMF96608.1 AarF/UbiB family protein [Aromatoleum toluolicum]
MLWQAIGAVCDLGRLHDIASVLIRYGFGDLVRRIGMAGALERAGRALHWHEPEELARLEPPARLRRALEELGPSFVKLGQILATRVDLFPPEWIAEFSKLQDAAPAIPFAELLPQLTEDLGEPPEAIFPRLEMQALAAASLAQVHRAWLADGTAVILKVRRPGIRPIVEADLRLLARLAEIVEAEAPELRRYRPREVVRHFTLSLRRELDFSAEGRSAERIAAHFADHPEIVVPRIHWPWTGGRLNVQDYVDGIAGRDLAAVDAAGLDRRLLARRGARAVLKMMLEDGFFHADPHPGNVFYLPDNRIAFIDFGMVGRLSEERRYQLAVLLHGLVSHDAEKVAEVLLDWSGGAEIDSETLQPEIDAFADQYHGVPLKNLDLGAMLSDLVAILREHGLTLPPDLALLIKAFIALEGLGRQLDPDFDMAGEATPFLERVLLAHAAPGALVWRGWRALRDTLALVAGLPQDLRQLLRAARRGKLLVQVEVLPLKHFGDRLDRAASRLAISVVTAALIIGSAIVMTVEREPGLPSFGLLGFIAAVIGGIWVLFSIWRGGKG